MTNFDERQWHACSVAEVLSGLDASPEGLSEEAVAERLARFGPNRLIQSQPVSVLRILGDQFTSVVALLLASAAAVSLMLDDWIEAGAIAVVLALNAGIGFVSEFRARRAMEALREFDISQTSVIRAGRPQVVDAETLVPGDILVLNTGQSVPADARLLSATDFRATEAALTGESLPVSKHAERILGADTPLADRVNMLYKGTAVAGGLARAIVIATGSLTEIGRIGTLVSGLHEERTPLERRLDALGRRLVWLALAVAGAVAGLEALHGAPLGLVIQTGIALAVAAVPEALPTVVTIALAVGLHRMARRHALVRRLPAVEALGSTTVVCTDKTRTLTSGDMTIVRVWTNEADFDLRHDRAEGLDASLRHALEVAAFASQPQTASEDPGRSVARDPVDEAIVAAAAGVGIDVRQLTGQHRRVGLVPFSSHRKLMASFHEQQGTIVAYVKGAPRTLLDLSSQLWTAHAPRPLDPAERERLHAVNETLAASGLRVLALAFGPATAPQEAALGGLTFTGFIGLMDPPAPGVADTIALLQAAGLRTIMLTGDQRRTAEAIGRELGLLSRGDQVIDERELRTLSPADLEQRLMVVRAFSRVTPEDKLAIVRSLQARGEIVAMLGDGVNDAPALKKADVGIAMGRRGTDVAREAADIVLQDDRFETIAAAVEEGRIIYDNIGKFVFYLFSCNLAEILVLLIAGAAGLPSPLQPLQILWLNMITDTFPALALAMEPGDSDVMQRPPGNPQEAVLSRAFLGRIAFYGGLITASTLAAFTWALQQAPTKAVTVSFMTLAISQVLHLGNARSIAAVLHPAHALANPYAVAAVVLSLGLQVMPAQISALADLLGVRTLDITEWAVVFALSAMPAVIGQILKIVRRPATPAAKTAAATIREPNPRS